MKPISLIMKILALTVIQFICFAVASAIAIPSTAAAPEDQSTAAAALFAVCLLNTAVLAYLILRSRWSGWRLTATVFLLLYGVTTVMSQIESAFFLTRLPEGMLPRLFLMGALTSALFSPLAVLILGKWKPRGYDPSPPLNLRAWKIALIAVLYLTLYFTFGYFIAWKNPAVREFYGGAEPGNFFAQMRNVAEDTPWLFPFQILRGLMWTALALGVIRMMKGRWWEAALAVALLFSVVMNTQLLLPNPLMPAEVRMIHLLETATSNFLFGWLAVWLLRLNPFQAKLASPESV